MKLQKRIIEVYLIIVIPPFAGICGTIAGAISKTPYSDIIYRSKNEKKSNLHMEKGMFGVKHF
jgi:hypothetical protein